MKLHPNLSRTTSHTKSPRSDLCRSLRWRLSLLLSVALLSCSCSSTPPPSLAITHVTLIDATGAAPQPNMTVFLSDEKIAAIGPSDSVLIPRKTKTFDATGKFLIPGLVDMHVHLTGGRRAYWEP